MIRRAILICTAAFALSAMAEPFPLSPGLWTWLGTNRMCAVPAMLESDRQEPMEGHFLYQDQPVGFCKVLGAGSAAVPLAAGPESVFPMIALGAVYGIVAPWIVNITERNVFFIRKDREDLEALSASDSLSYEFPFWSRPCSVRRLGVSRHTAIRLKSIAWGRAQTLAETREPVAVQGLRIVVKGEWYWADSPSILVPVSSIVATVRSDAGNRATVPLAALRTRNFCLRALEAAQDVNPLSHIQLRK